MGIDKYSVISVRNEDGKIEHNYFGEVNGNVNEYEPVMQPIDETDPGVRKIRKFHRNYLLATGERKITTEVVGKKTGLLKLLGNLLKN